jgi:hypothetical protein
VPQEHQSPAAPISRICGGIGRELRELLGETDVMPVPPPRHEIVL